jgi:hypothetical protein
MAVSDLAERVRAAVTATAVAFTAAVWAACPGAAAAADDSILLVIDRMKASGDLTMPAHYVPRPVFNDFFATSLVEFGNHRAIAASAARDILQTEARRSVADMRERLPAFADWRYAFFSSYRFTFSALVAAVSGGDANEAVRATVRERFQSQVVDPYAVSQRMEAAAIRTQEKTVAWRGVFVASQYGALDELVSRRGVPWDGRPANAVVTESVLLFPPAPGSGGGRTAGVDPIGGTPTIALPSEAAVLATRQATRRGVGVVAEPLIVVPAAEAVAGAAGLAATSFVGAATFAVGIAAEYLIVRTWDAVDRDAFLAETNKALDDVEAELLREAARQAEALTDANFGTVPLMNAALP